MGQSTESIGTGGRRPKCETREKGRVAEPLGTSDLLQTGTQFVRSLFFFMYDQRPSVSNRDLATMVRTPHERRYMHCVGFICLGT